MIDKAWTWDSDIECLGQAGTEGEFWGKWVLLLYILTMGAEAAEGAGAGAAVLWVGASLDADLTTLLVHLVGRALAHGCRQ